jgi:hypothetical protein
LSVPSTNNNIALETPSPYPAEIETSKTTCENICCIEYEPGSRICPHVAGHFQSLFFFDLQSFIKVPLKVFDAVHSGHHSIRFSTCQNSRARSRLNRRTGTCGPSLTMIATWRSESIMKPSCSSLGKTSIPGGGVRRGGAGSGIAKVNN